MYIIERMIVYLYGKDSYRRTKKLNEIIRLNKEKQPNADIFFIDLSEDQSAWQKAKEFLEQPSMFSDSKTLVVCESGEVEEKEWIKILKKQVTTSKVFVIISDSCAKPKKAFSFLISEPVKIQEFPELEGKTLESFLKKEAEKKGLIFDKDSWYYFLQFLDSKKEKAWVGIRELEKMECAGFGSPISKKEITKIIHFDEETNIFNASRELMGSGQVYKKMALLEALLIQKEDAPHLFNLLAYNASGAQAVRLADLDIAIKSGNSDYEEALLDFIL